jgi:ADP-heptose:LPS heptosyltransferase
MTGERVLVARLDSDGDVLLAGPAIRAIAETGARVTLLCSTRGEAAAALLPGVRDRIVFDAPWVLADPPPVDNGRVRALSDEVARREFDTTMILTSFHQTPLPLALLLRMAGVGRIGANSVDYPGSLVDVRVVPREDAHEVERNLTVAARLGYRLPPGDDGGLAILPLTATGPCDHRPYVAVHPGASVRARAWSPRANARTVGALVADGWRVVVTGSDADVAVAGTVRGAAHPSQVENLAGRTSLRELAAVLAGAAAVVVGNTGPAHLAAAVGTPVVSVFAPTVPAANWRPWKVPHVLLGQQDIGCAGCRCHRCPVVGQPCLAGISAEDVVRAVRRVARVVAGRGAA